MAKPESSLHHELLGRLLRAARRRRELTQSQVAARMGSHQSVVARFEKGTRHLDVVEFVLAARAVGVSPVKLVRRLEREMFPPADDGAGGGDDQSPVDDPRPPATDRIE